MTAGAGETPRALAHQVTDLLIEVDLATELEALRASDSYRVADHAAKTIAKQPGVRVVLIALKPGGEMHGHHANWAITVQGIDGRVDFTMGESGRVDTGALGDRSGRNAAPRQRRGRERVPLDDRWSARPVVTTTDRDRREGSPTPGLRLLRLSFGNAWLPDL